MAFYIGVYAYAIIVHTQADQLLLQLLMEQFDTFPLQCRHIEHMHEGVWFIKNNFGKMTAVRTKTIFLWWVYCFHVVRPSVRPSVTFCFLNILKIHC